MPDFVRRIPDGDNRERLVCAECGHVAYENPKVVTGAVVAHHGRVLLCRRSINPRSGFWTIPAGYLELGETVEEGAKREAAEEACAAIELDGILGIFSLSRLGQVQIFFRGRFSDPDAECLHQAGAETLETRLFAWQDVPWSDLAFSTVHWALNAWRQTEGRPLGPPAANPPDDMRGATALPEGPR
jgi:ADP-ribose pyrophosphatase YjhB (NUDIX family)